MATRLYSSLHIVPLPAAVLAWLCLTPSAAAADAPVLQVQLVLPEARADDADGDAPDGQKIGEVRSVHLLNRDVPQERFGKEVKVEAHPGVPDEKTGRWIWRELPAGTYDLLVETEHGRLEGFDARPGFDSDVELKDEDRTKIRELLDNLKTFCNEKRFLYLDGHGEEAVAAVELVRSTPTHLRTEEPSVIWRVERWTYRRHGAWVRSDTPRVLRRYLVPRRRYDTWHWNFLPALGGLDIDPHEPREVSVTLPAFFTPDRGRAGPEAPRRDQLP